MNTRKIIKIIIGTTVSTAAIGYLLYQAAGPSMAYCCTVDEFVDSNSPKQAAANNRSVRLVGWVKDGSIIKSTPSQLDFQLAGQEKSVPVRYNAIAPNNFIAGKEVFVEGKMTSDGILHAKNILTRCDSKYKMKLPKPVDSK